jgi:hypothetical protein
VTKSSISFDFLSSDFRLLEPGDFLFKLAAKARVKEIQETIDDSKEKGGVNVQELND